MVYLLNTKDIYMEFISIGPYCDATGMLKKHNLRLSSYPFDYIFSSLELIKHAIEDKFHIFLDKCFQIY